MVVGYIYLLLFQNRKIKNYGKVYL
jgi:hypothetical protein